MNEQSNKVKFAMPVQIQVPTAPPALPSISWNNNRSPMKKPLDAAINDAGEREVQSAEAVHTREEQKNIIVLNSR
jgi:hypothetical protein